MTGKLVEALARTGFVGVSKIAIRSRERLALLRPRHEVLVVQTLLWADELRDPGDLAPSAPVTDRELELAHLLRSPPVVSLPGPDTTSAGEAFFMPGATCPGTSADRTGVTPEPRYCRSVHVELAG
ncbi:Ku protein [Streptomyces atratus]|uniref:Ku protein n=1 Tax=Streptomyces atratus TaxID=1893 RepID=UPI0036CFD548